MMGRAKSKIAASVRAAEKLSAHNAKMMKRAADNPKLRLVLKKGRLVEQK